ncbi:site-specific integrase [Candidatus Woesebacteria bacterium]|nr:site-specific integrase [Candidatus Woesebacteria bacterium]
MDISLSSQKFLNSFLNYLSSSGVSDKSLKYYRSDISHFTGWIILKVRTWGIFAETVTEIIPFINTRLAYEYKIFLTQNNISPKTVNRRLSTLRHLSRFLLASQISNSDFMEGISNIDISPSRPQSIHPLVALFEKKLEAEKVSKNTVRNYISDVKHFINWLETRNGKESIATTN